MKMIMAVAENFVVGKDNGLPWRQPTDLAFFKEKTMGHDLLMGLNTFQSLPGMLPGRMHHVLSSRGIVVRSPMFMGYKSIEEFFERNEDTENVFVIGGPTLWKQLAHKCNTLYVTLVHGRPDGDVTYMPDMSLWDIQESKEVKASAKDDYDMTFITYKRR